MKVPLKSIGFTGSLFSLLCCLGFGPLIAFLSAIGAGFLINDAILAPLLIVFLVLGGVGLGLSTSQAHRSTGDSSVERGGGDSFHLHAVFAASCLAGHCRTFHGIIVGFHSRQAGH